MDKKFKAPEIPWNKHTLYSAACLALSVPVFMSAPFIADLSSGLSPVSMTGYRVFLAAMAVSVFAPYALFVLLLAAAGYFGIRAILQTEKTEHRGRWLAIIISTLSLSLVVAMILFNVTEFLF